MPGQPERQSDGPESREHEVLAAFRANTAIQRQIRQSVEAKARGDKGTPWRQVKAERDAAEAQICSLSQQ